MIIERNRLRVGSSWKYIESGIVYTIVGYAIGAGKNHGSEFVLYQDFSKPIATYSRDVREWDDSKFVEIVNVALNAFSLGGK